MCVADLFAGTAVGLSCRSMAAFDESAVRQKGSDSGESFDGVNFVQHRHRQNPADAGNGLQAKQRLRIINFGRSFDMQFELSDLVVEKICRANVEVHGRFNTGIVKSIRESCAIRFVSDRFFKGIEVMLIC